jgi:hypothetical protein
VGVVVMINYIKFAIQGRSSKWSKVRKEFLASKWNGSCAACKRDTGLEVHHIIPFDLRPDLELSQSNLITLCKYCHFIFGHFGDYITYNLNVRDDTKWYHVKLLLTAKSMKG